MEFRQHNNECLLPRDFDVKGWLQVARRMQETDVKLTIADQFNSLIAIDLAKQQFHIRIGFAEARNRLWHNLIGRSTYKSNGEPTELPSIGTLGGVDGLRRVVKEGSNPVQEHASGGGERDRALRSLKQRDADFQFQPFNLLAQMRLSETQPASRARKVELLGHGDEEAKAAMVHGSYNCFGLSESLSTTLTAYASSPSMPLLAAATGCQTTGICVRAADWTTSVALATAPTDSAAFARKPNFTVSFGKSATHPRIRCCGSLSREDAARRRFAASRRAEALSRKLKTNLSTDLDSVPGRFVVRRAIGRTTWWEGL